MRSSMLIDGTDLTHWADRRDAQAQLPRLLRRLIIRTTTHITRIDFRAGEGIQLSGLDGSLDVIHGNEYVPSGQSAWECSTRGDIRTKANEDYEKRCRDPHGLVLDQSTFIFITPRRWGGKENWESERRSEGVWHDVRAYDADDLEAWLELTPVVHNWLSNILGKYPENAIDLETYIKNWSETIRPAISINFVLSGRDEVIKVIHGWLSDPSTPLALKAGSRKEALAVFAATLNVLPIEIRNFHVIRTIIIHDIPTWNRMAVTGEPRILIPLFDDLSAIIHASNNGHHVVVPLGRPDSESASTIIIPKLSVDQAASSLLPYGIPESYAYALASLASKSLIAFRRRLSLQPEFQSPEWSRPENGVLLIPIMLSGTWDDDNDGDKQVISMLSQEPYETYISILIRWSNESDPPIRHIRNRWSVISKQDLWSLLAQYLTRRDLDRFEEACLQVFNVPDPRYDLPIDQRWMAPAFGASPLYSSILVESLAETLAIMGGFGEMFPYSSDLPFQDYAIRICYRIFQHANCTWKVWATLSDQLPYIAEAAPDTLLTSIDRIFECEPSILSELFIDKRGLLSVSSPHTGILWALETLMWNHEYFGYASLLLARFAQVDPGGQLSNRPMNSLYHIFYLGRPQTSATLDQRSAVLDTLRKYVPDVAWRLLCKLLPQYHSIHMYTRKPRWRNWAPNTIPPITGDEYLDSVHEIVIKLLSDVGTNGNRWNDLLKTLSRLPENEYNVVYNHLSEIDSQQIASSDRVLIWDTLRDILSRHRSFPEAGWVLPTNRLDQLDEQYQRFEPDILTDRYKWLFSDAPKIPEGFEKDWRTGQERLLLLQLSAVNEICRTSGFPGVLDLLRTVNRPDILGSVVGQTLFFEELENEILLEHLSSAENIFALFSKGFSQGRIINRGRAWAERKLREVANTWTPEKRADFLTCLTRDANTWAIAESFDSETERIYWERVYPYGIDEDNYELAARKLIEYNRPNSAICLISMHAEHADPFPAVLGIEALEKALRVSSETDPISNLFGYHISVLFDHLEGTEEIEETRIALLEWAYLPLLESHRRSPRVLHNELSRNPDFFADVLRLVFSSADDQEREMSDDDNVRARRGYDLLKTWQTIPGSSENEIIDDDLLRNWIIRARDLTSTYGLGEKGDYWIGRIFSHSPTTADNIWPHPVICSIIDDLASAELDRGFKVGILSNQGVIMRRVSEGGQPERQQAERYDSFASIIRDSWPRTSQILRRIASEFRSRSRRSETDLQLMKDFE